MSTWLLTLQSPDGTQGSVETVETQFVVGTETAPDVYKVTGAGVAARHAWVWIGEAGLQVDPLGGETFVNGHAISERVQAEYPASVQVGEVTLVVERQSARLAAAFAETIPIACAQPAEPDRPGNDLAITIPAKAAKNLKPQPPAEDPALAETIPATKSGATQHARQVSVTANFNKAPVNSEYTLMKEIARGGMGQIHLGDDPQLERQVAVKVSTLAQGEDDSRFAKEAVVLARLAHPNIVPIYARGTDAQGRPFYSMKLIKGRTLQAVLNALREGDAAATKEYTQAALLTILRKVCDAMAFAHAREILHRDLKPENIMVGEYGEVLVMDWGLAKVLGGSDQVGPEKSPVRDTGEYGMTMEGEVMGTPQYMSPEQAEGVVAGLDARSDIYSLGGVLYAILTLRPPVEGKTLNEVLTKVKKGDITSMTTKRGGREAAAVGAPPAMGLAVPEALQAVTLKAMSTDRTKRYETVEAFAADIESYQNGFATSAEQAGFGRQIFLLVKRNRAVSGLCAALLVCAMVFSLRLIASERKAVQEKTAAEISRAKAQIALAQSEDQVQNPQAMRRILDEVSGEYRDQQWSYLSAKLAPSSVTFDNPGAPVDAAFSTNKAPGCFLTVQTNGDVRYLDPATGFGSPMFRLSGPVKDLVTGFFEDADRAWLAIVTNRSSRFGETTHPASLEVLEVPSGKSLYKLGLNQPCVSVEFSPRGNLLRLESRPPVPATIQMRNAHTGEMVWEGGPKERVSSKFSPDERRLVCVIESKGFQDLDPWTGESLGALKTGPGRAGTWSPKTDRLYAIWNFADRQFIRGFNTANGEPTFEFTVAYGSTRGIHCAGRWLFLATSRSSEGRVVQLLDSVAGIPVHKAYLIGDYDKFSTHADENHFLCLGGRKAVFLRWNFAESLVAGLPPFYGPFFFTDGNSGMAVRTAKGNNLIFSVLDITKPRGDAGPAFSVRVRGGIFANKAGNLFSYKEDSPTGEAVIARADAQGIRQVSRWKCPSIPQLSPSGERAWTREGLYETASGQMLQKYDRKELGGTHASRWLDEKHVLEISWIKRTDETAVGEFSETVFVLWEVDTGRMLLKVPEPRARSFGVSPDGLWIAEGGEDGRLRIRSAKTLEIQREYKVHDSDVSSAEWHPTKPVIVTCSRDFWVKAWDVRDGALVQSFRCTYFPTNVAINQRGDLLGVGNYSSSQVLALDLSHVHD
jgi:serine/threonine protein kinase